jgi:hypothetical protein
MQLHHILQHSASLSQGGLLLGCGAFNQCTAQLGNLTNPALPYVKPHLRRCQDTVVNKAGRLFLPPALNVEP